MGVNSIVTGPGSAATVRATGYELVALHSPVVEQYGQIPIQSDV